MKWSVLETALPAAITSASGLSDVSWKHQATEWREDVFVLLEVLNLTNPYPADERRLKYDAGEDVIKETVQGLRELTVQVTIESHSQKLGDSAKAFAEVIRARLWSTTIRDTLYADGEVSLVSVGDVLPAPYLDRDDRMRSVAIFELGLRGSTAYSGGDLDPVERMGISAMGGDEELVP